MNPLLISAAGVLLSAGVALAVVFRVAGKLEARVATVERDTERLREEKASKESVDGLKGLLERLEAEVRVGFREIKDAIRERNREHSGHHRIAPGGE